MPAFSFQKSNFLSNSVEAMRNSLFDAEESLLLPPPESKQDWQQTSVVLLPGCQLRPEQYTYIAKRMQEASDQAVWIAIPKLPMNVVNPLVLPSIVKSALKELQDRGYNGDNKTYVGGHSLGGVFMPLIFDEAHGLAQEQVLGTINLGCFQQRGTPEESRCGHSQV